jgi:type II secretory pathway component PulF
MRAGHRRIMRFLNNLKLLTKIAIPVVFFIAIAVGLIVMAVSSPIRSMKTSTRSLSLMQSD